MHALITTKTTKNRVTFRSIKIDISFSFFKCSKRTIKNRIFCDIRERKPKKCTLLIADIFESFHNWKKEKMLL